MREKEQVISQNTFSRTLANDSKRGAYYTDIPHVKSCGTFFDFPAEEEVCCFDNSAGDGEALLSVTEGCAKRVLFVNDINAKTAAELREKGSFEAVTCADYLTSFECTNGVFSFFWCNPPYGEDVATHERYEKKFVEKIFSHLARGAAGVFILPEYVLSDDRFARVFLARFTPRFLFRFREPVYQQFKQCCAIVTRKDVNGFTKEELQAYLARCSSLEEMPETWEGEKVMVQPSNPKRIQNYKSRIFDEERWLAKVIADTQLSAAEGKYLAVKYWSDEVKYRPPITLGDSHLAMQATCGIGAGAVGSEDAGNYHLQRGSVRRKKETSVRPKQNGKEGMEAVEIDHAEISIKIAEQVMENGRPCLKITDLM